VQNDKSIAEKKIQSFVGYQISTPEGTFSIIHVRVETFCRRAAKKKKRENKQVNINSISMYATRITLKT
jgi:hypothetical protein